MPASFAILHKNSVSFGCPDVALPSPVEWRSDFQQSPLEVKQLGEVNFMMNADYCQINCCDSNRWYFLASLLLIPGKTETTEEISQMKSPN